ncbi:GIP [Symbiodinium sp. KB8]|nr:GIP [Symbiodinium sp. KB8]
MVLTWTMVRDPGDSLGGLEMDAGAFTIFGYDLFAGRTPVRGIAGWQKVTSAVMRDVSEQSGVWWETVMQEVSPEKTKPEMKVLHLRDLRVCTMSRSTTALLDSGATHSLRAASSLAEWNEADEVAVQLAGSHQLVMRITPSGTLLMPYKGGEEESDKSSPLHPQTIVPMGQLISTLGYTMVWSPDGCVLTSPDGQALRLHVEAGCPQLCEMEALSLIARLEDRKLEQLGNAVITTQDKVEVAAMAMEQSWHAYLYDYVANGAFESGLRAIRDAPTFEDLPGECLTNLIPAAGLWSGWDIMKNIGFLTRAQRRRFLTSKRWVVHLFAGTEGHWEIMKLDQGDTVVLELDKDRCLGQDLMRNEVWRMLLWGAKEGKIDVIMGGPPGRYQQYAKGGQRDPKHLTLIARMMWLYAVAQVGREINGGSLERNRDVGFIVEYPEGTPQSVREDRLRAIAEAEELLRRPGERAGVASWDETRFFWEHVQRPRWELQVGESTMNGLASFWDTRLWKMFEKEFQMRTVSFDQGLDATSKGTMGKNLRYLLVAKYLVPRKYTEDFSGNTPPDDNGVQPAIPEPTSKDAGADQQQHLVEDMQTIEEFFQEKLGEVQGDDGPVAVEVISLGDGQVTEQLPQEEELDYEPSEPDEEDDEAQGDEGSVGNVLMQEGDCDPPDMSFLTFAVALPNNRSNTVKQALQDIVMYLQMHGMPVYRFHSDKGEFFSNNFRAWLRDMGIFGTWSEPSVPQSNGHAESTVRWIKDRTRTLLRSASLPVKLWPVAAAMAAAEQRAKVLSWKSKLVAPFGATVYLRKKAFDKYGPLRRENGLDSKWYKGRYVGLSTIVSNGHLVYIPGNDEEKEKFLHTLHVRADLIEPNPPDVQLVGDDVPKPRRRITSKRDMGSVEMKALTKLSDEAKDVATTGAEEVLKDWSWDRARSMATEFSGEEVHQDNEWAMYLDLNPGEVETGEIGMSSEGCPQIYKTEVTYTHNVEEVLGNLAAPLDVTYTVSPDEVMRNLEVWRPAIMKEIKGVEEAIVKLTPGSELRQQWLKAPGLQRLPTKFVFTVKPNDKADPQDSSTWYKRKARLVICGNMAANDGSQVYTETAPAEAVRTALALTSRYRWHVAILDVVAAFLRTPLGRSSRDPVVVAQPPRLLEVLGVSVKMGLWGLVRALYGLREAPMLWGNFRDDTLRDLLPPRGLRWEQGKTITSWWSIRDEQGKVQAIIVVYVDDFMLCGPMHLVTELGKAIQEVWETSELSFLGPDNSIRFLGMELQRDLEDAEDILLFQQGYIWELLRSHGVAKTQLDKVPITKELSIIPEKSAGEPESLIRQAQQVTGEVLWISQRTRPDLAFAASMMASLSTKLPSQAISIGHKVLGYLQRTVGYGLSVRPEITWWVDDHLRHCADCMATYGCFAAKAIERELQRLQLEERFVEQLEFGEVEFSPFEFDPPGTYPPEGRDWTDYCRSFGPAKARFLLEDKLPRAFELGKAVGIDFRMDRRIVHTIDVNTALLVAQKHGVAEPFALEMLKMHFEGLQDPNNRSSLSSRLDCVEDIDAGAAPAPEGPEVRGSIEPPLASNSPPAEMAGEFQGEDVRSFAEDAPSVQVSIGPERKDASHGHRFHHSLTGEVLGGTAIKPEGSYFPASLTFSYQDLFWSKVGAVFWINMVCFIVAGGLYRVSLWMGWRVAAAAFLATVLSLCIWQSTWQMGKLAIGTVPTAALLLDLLLAWTMIFCEKYFLGLFRSYSMLVLIVCSMLVCAPFGGRQMFGMTAVAAVRLVGIGSILMGYYFVLIDFPSETIQDLFWPLTASVYKALAGPLMYGIWNGPGRRDCSALFVTTATLLISISSEGWYYAGLVLMLFSSVGTEYQIMRRAATSIAAHSVFALLGRFNMVNTMVFLLFRKVARRCRWREPHIHAFGARKDLVLRSSTVSGAVAWGITFSCCVIYMLSTLPVYMDRGCERASPTCHYLFRPATYLVGFCAALALVLTELVVAIGMRWLRQARGDDEASDWTFRAMAAAVYKLSLPGMHVQAFSTAASRDVIPPDVNLSIDQVPGLLCLSARECAACLSSTHVLSVVVSTVGTGLIVGMQEELDTSR